MQILKLLLLVCLIGFIFCDGDSNTNNNNGNSTQNTNGNNGGDDRRCENNIGCCVGLRKYNYVFTLASDENLSYNPAFFGTLTPFLTFGGFTNAQINQLREDAEDWYLTRFGFNFTGLPVVNVDGCMGCKFLVINGQTITLSPLFFNSTVRVIATSPPEGFDIIKVADGNKCTRYYTLEFVIFIPGGIPYGGTYGNDPRLLVTSTVGNEVIAYGNYIIQRGNKRRMQLFKSVYPARLEQVFAPFTYEVDSFVMLDSELGVCSVSIASRVDGFGTTAPYLSNQRFVFTCPGSFSQPEFNQF